MTDDAVMALLPNDAPDNASDNLASMRVRHLLSMSTVLLSMKPWRE